NCPDDDKTYLHRTGRTGRAGKKGTAITFVDWEDLARWALIARQLGLESTEARETYSTSEHLFTDLDIPSEAKGTLPESARTREGLEAEELEDLGGPDSSRGGRESSRGGRGGGRGERGGRDRRSSSRGGRGGGGERRGGAAGSDTAERSGSEQRGGERPRRSRSRSRTRRVHGEVVEATQGGEPSGEGRPRRRRSRGGRGRSGQGSARQESRPAGGAGRAHVAAAPDPRDQGPLAVPAGPSRSQPVSAGLRGAGSGCRSWRAPRSPRAPRRR